MTKFFGTRKVARTMLKAARDENWTRVSDMLVREKMPSDKEYLNVVDANNGWTCLHYACYHGDEIVEILLQHGADLKVTNKYGERPLFLACQSGNLRVVQGLLRRGDNGKLARRDGFTPLYIASQHGQTHIVHFLLTRGEALVNDNWNESGGSALMIACRNGHIQVCKLLLDNGANVNAKTTKSQRTPLLIAAYWGHEEIVRMLLAHGADILARDEDGTCADQARLGNHPKLEKKLLEVVRQANAPGTSGEAQRQILMNLFDGEKKGFQTRCLACSLFVGQLCV